MNKKEVTYLTLAAAMFLITGWIAFRFIKPQQTKTVEVEVVAPIVSEFDREALAKLQDPAINRNFFVPVNLQTGLNNPRFFGPF